MESPVIALFVLAALSGVAALEVRQARVSVIATGVAFVFVALAMFVMGAVEAGVATIIAGAVLVLVLNWGFRRTGQRDELPRVPTGSSGVLAALALVVFAIVAIVAVSGLTGEAMGSESAAAGSHVGLLREAVVILAALTAVWAMLRKSGRRDE
jgi:peptidoglycan biosynthesis protein MviN/MurJ (putative lipid II flippase)